MNPFMLQVSNVVHEERLQEAANHHLMHQSEPTYRLIFINRAGETFSHFLTSLALRLKTQLGMPIVNPPAADYPVIVF